MNRESMSSISRRASTSAATTILLLVAPCFATPLQVPGGASRDTAPGKQFEQDADYGTAEATASNAEDQARRFLEEREWTEGRNGDTDSGFIVFLGKAPIVEGTPRDFADRRGQAAAQALLNAKKGMVKYLAAEVGTRLRQKYQEGSPPLDEIAAAKSISPKEPGALAKLEAILNFELNKQLSQRGIDPSLQSPEERVKAQEEAQKRAMEAAREVLSSSEFEDAVEIAAEHEICGLQAFKTFEDVGESGSGQIAVIAISSPKTQALQRALLGLAEAPRGTPGQKVAHWARAQGSLALLYTHGVQFRTDERGELVLVGFGQASPIGKSAMQLNAASDKAEADAQRQLRRFMGELIRSREADVRASRVSDFADDTSAFEDLSRYEAEVEAIAKNLKMPGMVRVHSWNAVHPQSDRPTFGAVFVYSVSEISAAKELSERLKEASAGKGTEGIGPKAGPSTKPIPKEAPRGRPSSGQGAEGESP